MDNNLSLFVSDLRTFSLAYLQKEMVIIITKKSLDYNARLTIKVQYITVNELLSVY